MRHGYHRAGIVGLLLFLQEQAGVDIYEKKNQPSNATGGVQLGPESAAFAAVQRAAALAGPSMIHCDLCNVSSPYHCSSHAHEPRLHARIALVLQCAREGPVDSDGHTATLFPKGSTHRY